MLWPISPAMATTIARQQTIEEIRESRRLRAARVTPDPVEEPRGRHKARRRTRSFWFVDLRRRLVH